MHVGRSIVNIIAHITRKLVDFAVLGSLSQFLNLYSLIFTYIHISLSRQGKIKHDCSVFNKYNNTPSKSNKPQILGTAIQDVCYNRRENHQ